MTGLDARALRLRNGWSLQHLANISKINKAYLSEFENGQRVLPSDEVVKLRRLLEQEQPPVAGRASPALTRESSGRLRLVFVGQDGQEVYRPEIAHLEWTEADGTTYRMYLGD